MHLFVQKLQSSAATDLAFCYFTVKCSYSQLQDVAELTRVKSEEDLDDEVVEWTRVLNAKNKWCQSTLPTACHGVGT